MKCSSMFEEGMLCVCVCTSVVGLYSLSVFRVVVFVDLLNELIELALAKFTNLTDAQKMEVAMYIIPEVSSARYGCVCG